MRCLREPQLSSLPEALEGNDCLFCQKPNKLQAPAEESPIIPNFSLILSIFKDKISANDHHCRR